MTDAACAYVTDDGGAMTMDDYAARCRAYDAVLKPETQRGVHVVDVALDRVNAKQEAEA